MADEANASRSRTPRFQIEVQGDDNVKEHILGMIKEVRRHLTVELNHPATTGEVLRHTLQYYVQRMRQAAEATPTVTQPMPRGYLPLEEASPDEKMFVISESSFQRCLEVAECHGRSCRGKLSTVNTRRYICHAAVTKVRCRGGMRRHQYTLHSSPYLPNNTLLVNARMAHGAFASGMLPVQYTRMCKGAGIGCMSKKIRERLFSIYSEAVSDQVKDSCDQALDEELTFDEEGSRIDVVSYARHGCRKKSKDTSVVFLGENTRKVIHCEYVTRLDHPNVQSHDRLGTQRSYDFFRNLGVSLGVHTHSRTAAVNKIARENNAVNQNSVWHAVRAMKKNLANISSGPQCEKNVSWFEQLSDKTEPVCTHVRWAVRNCQGDPERLRKSLDNIVRHYKNDHRECHPESRCRKDTNYIMSRQRLTDPKAENALQSVIRASVIYKNPADYLLAKDSSSVGCFDNVSNVFQDNRINFSSKVYKTRGQLAVCHWNDNVYRKTTSVSITQEAEAPRQTRRRSVYGGGYSYIYRDEIWNRFITALRA